MTCQGAIGRVPGVRSVDVLTAAGVVVVEHDERLSVDDVRRAAGHCGLGLVPAEARETELERRQPQRECDVSGSRAGQMRDEGPKLNLLRVRAPLTWAFGCGPGIWTMSSP